MEVLPELRKSDQEVNGMPNYHVGCGICEIYAGTLNKKGDTWKEKTSVTNEALSAVAQYLLMWEKEYRFNLKDGEYVLKVERR